MNQELRSKRGAILRYLAVAAFGVNGALLLVAGLTNAPGFAKDGTAAPGSGETASATAPTPAELLAESLQQLAAELKARDEALKERELKSADQERRLLSLATRLGVDPNNVAAAARPKQEEAAASRAGSPAGEQRPGSDMFKRLLASYENMEPENAAAALRRLFGIDRDAVVELVSGMSSRKAGGVLDALASTDPAMTADLSHELWLRGKAASAAGGL